MNTNYWRNVKIDKSESSNEVMPVATGGIGANPISDKMSDVPLPKNQASAISNEITEKPILKYLRDEIDGINLWLKTYKNCSGGSIDGLKRDYETTKLQTITISNKLFFALRKFQDKIKAHGEKQCWEEHDCLNELYTTEFKEVFGVLDSQDDSRKEVEAK
jgi:hypothetical protein